MDRIAWPLVAQGFYASVHHPSEWTNRETGKLEEGVPGLTFTNLGAALNHALSVAGDKSLAKHHLRNVYLAMGGEIATKGTYGAKIIANRVRGNVGACAALWADVDVKPSDPNAYGSANEMTAGFQQFLEKSGMPFPNLVVNSGQGGKHLYWLLDRLLEPEEWMPFARALINAAKATGFKIDAKCTRDICRLLRIAGTWNFKTDPPKPVKLIYDDGKTHSVEKLQQILAPYQKTASSLLTATSKPEVVMRQSPLFDHMKDDYDDMGKKPEYSLADIEEVAKHCPFIGHTLATGGVDLVGNDAWHTMAALSCYTTEPSKTIHRLCEKNEFYDRERGNRGGVEPVPAAAHTAPDRPA